MNRSRRILMPVRTVAEWGGVHEWTVDAAKALIKSGHKVTFVGQGSTFEIRAKNTGADFFRVDWSQWQKSLDTIQDSVAFDLIFSHAPEGRKLGLALSQRMNCEHVVMIHGAFHDRMYEWSNDVDAFIAASPSLVHFAQRIGRVAPWKVTCVPNAAPDEIFELPLVSFKDKIANGEASIVTASRLSKDKVQQIGAVEQTVRILSKELPDVHWNIDVYGDGPLKGYFARRYDRLVGTIPNVSYSLRGWISPNEVPEKMNESFLTVTAGMAGMRACASGTLCLGVGARNNVGIQFGQNLRAGVWSNFGDHGIPNFTPTSIEKDLKQLCEPECYDEAVSVARKVIWDGNRQSVVDEKMLAALHC